MTLPNVLIARPKLTRPCAMNFDKCHIYHKRSILSVAKEGLTNFIKRQTPEPVDLAEEWELERPERFNFKNGLSYAHSNGRYQYVETRPYVSAQAESFIGSDI